MKRHHVRCPAYHGRMHRLYDELEDKERARGFYVCPRYANRGTLLYAVNGWSDVLPPEIFAQAVREGVLTPDGEVIS